MDYLSELVAAFKNAEPDPFDASVKAKAGDGSYRVIHSDGVTQMSTWVHDVLGDQVARRTVEKELGRIHGIPNLRLANVCCSACITSDGDLGDDLGLKIQLAAVNTEPDGSDAGH